MIKYTKAMARQIVSKATVRTIYLEPEDFGPIDAALELLANLIDGTAEIRDIETATEISDGCHLELRADRETISDKLAFPDLRETLGNIARASAGISAGRLDDVAG